MITNVLKKAAFTIITTDYVSYAKTLGDSILKYNPEYIFYIFLIGKKADLNNAVDLTRFIVIDTQEFEENNLVEIMTHKYTNFELSCALKPYCATQVLKNQLITRLKYFDSDIIVFNPFNQALENDVTSSIFITPHFFTPVDPSEHDTTNDSTLLKSGIYNAGYFEVANNKVSHDFLKWWKSRLFDNSYSFKAPFDHVFVDQSWLNLVPIYFKESLIVTNLGYNASFYNLHEREICKNGDTYFINGNEELVFFHFTGYKYYHHEMASMYNTKYTYANTPFLELICSEYKDALIKNFVHITFPQPPVIDKTKMQFVGKVIKLTNKILEKAFKVKFVRVEP